MTRFSMQVPSGNGRAESLEITVRDDAVEVRWAGRRIATLAREDLLRWLVSPDGGTAQLCADETLWTRDAADGVTVMITCSGSWLLSLDDVQDLRGRL